MKELLFGLFNSKSKRIIRIIDLLLIFAALIFFIYEKKTPCVMHFEADDFSLTTINDQYAYTSEKISLGRGVYIFSLNALASEEGATLSLSSPSLSGIRLRTAAAELPTTSLSSYIKADLRGKADDLQIVVTPCNGGVFEIMSLDLSKTTDTSKRFSVIAVFIIILLEIALKLSLKDVKTRKVALILTSIFLISSYPLFSDYLLESHDILFHLARIEGLSQGLKNGVFPVKIQPFWGNDYGYAVGVFYGDILLYFPAVLRLLGFSAQTAFQIHFAFIQLFTVLISYFSFKRMFKKTNTALFGTALYTLSVYRLQTTYTRAAIGEFTAMMFLPLVLCGFYMIIADRDPGEKKGNRLKSCLATAFGLTGIIGSHVLSCEMIAFFIILVLLICIKKVFVKRTFLDLLTALGMTLVLNIGFLLPFLDFYFQPLNIRSSSWSGGSSTGIQEYGLSPLQLFSVFGRENGGSYTTLMGINKEVSFSVGIVLVLILLLFVGLIVCKKDALKQFFNFKVAVLMAAFGALSLFMSTCYFPWNAISSCNEGLKTVISTIQFPWRFIGFATVFLVFVACFVFDVIEKLFTKEIFTSFLVSSGLLLFVSASWFMNSLVMESQAYRVYYTYDVCNYAFYTAEYLYEGTDFTSLVPDKVTTQNARVDNYNKKGTTIKANVTALGDSYVEFPLNYYKYYACSSSSGENFELVAGSNNCIKVLFPDSYTGDITVCFKEPLLWRLCELISILSFVYFVSLLCIINREK